MIPGVVWCGGGGGGGFFTDNNTTPTKVVLSCFELLVGLWQFSTFSLDLIVAKTQPTTQNNLQQLLLGWYYYR